MATAARTQTIVVAQPNARRSAVTRRRVGGRRGPKNRKGASPQTVRARNSVQHIGYGAISALLFGFLQRKVALPSIEGVPNSLTYGAGTAALAVVVGSDKLLKASCGPLFAGLHSVGLKGMGKGTDSVAGEWDSTEGEWDSTAGDQEEVTAGEFDDL
jgi:hypothetical protein